MFMNSSQHAAGVHRLKGGPPHLVAADVRRLNWIRSRACRSLQSALRAHSAFRKAHSALERLLRVPLLATFLGLGLGLTAAQAQEQPFISEFLAVNSRTLHDEDGDSSDWIEIHNPATNNLSLDGWFLTDDAANLAKWRFPNFVLAPDSYLVVFASDKNRTNLTGRLHTNFKLASAGEYLALCDPNTNVVSEFAPTYPPQATDVSYGRDWSDPKQLGYFSVPTPGQRNSTGGPGFAPEVLFDRSSGTFTSPFTLVLTLSAAVPDAVLRFTLNGTLPTNGSPIYTNSMLITNSIQVRARAFRPGYLPGPPHSEMFFLLNTNVQTVTSDLPLILLHTMGTGPANATVDKFVALAVFEPKFGVSSFLNPPDLVTRARFKIRGSSTEGEPKSSWAVEFWDEFNADRAEPFLGMPSDADWVFYGPNHFEPVLIHNPFAHALSRQIGRYSPRTQFAEIYQNTGGGAVAAANYNGIYAIEEKIKISKDRVNIDKLDPEDTALPQVTGGYLLKIDRPDPGDTGFGAAGQGILYVDPKEVEIELPQRDPQEQYIRNYFNAFGNALNSANFTNVVTGYPAFVDALSWIDHHLLNVLTFNVDAFRLSGYFYKPRHGPINMGPLWDFDRALASTDGRDLNPRVWRSQTGDLGTDFWNYPWWSRMFTDPDFFQLWIDRYQQLRDGAFSSDNLARLVDSLANQVRAAQPRDAARYGVRPRGVASNFPWMTALNGTYDGEVNALKAWLTDRTDFMDTNFLVHPRLSHSGGPVTPGQTVALLAPAGISVYYTTDGTDPRARGGGIATNASLYAAPVVINQNARVIARSYSQAHRNLTGANNPPISSPWSGPVAATFVATRIPLIITEIMYNPLPGPAGSGYSADDFEFIELKNIGTTPLALTGCRFTNGIQFTFAGDPALSLAPDEHIVLVRNTAAFVSRYGSGVRVAGEYTGSLDNGGERLYLEGPLREPILDFTYRDSWYPLSDGFGFSLVIVDEQAPPSAWNDPGQWRLSRDRGGAPGSSDPPGPAHPRVLVNEILTNPTLPGLDQIELFNPSTTPADISSWLLSDDLRTPQKFQFPAGTIIAPNAYLVLDESDFNIPGNPRAFGLSSHGEEIWLFSASAAGELTGYLHGFDFGPAAVDVSFGRYVDSQGTEQWPAQRTTTWNGPNARPLVGPVVISEIHYRPPDRQVFSLVTDNTLDEFIELRNITDETVLLYDPQFPTNTWTLTDAVQFAFTSGTQLPARGVAVVVGFPPTNLTQRTRFQSVHGLPESVPLYGPYRGRLDNSESRVELRQPTLPAADTGEVDGIVIDRVHYKDSAPWPSAADGLGLSLQRLVESDYGNDPTNWVAALPSPGRSYAGGVPPTILNSPTNRTLVAYTATTMTVGAVGPEPLRYQWLLNGHTMVDATNAILVLTNIQANQAGQYVAAVFNQAGVSWSDPATLNVLIPATILRQPENVSVKRGTNTSIFVQAVGTGVLTYQWYFNGQILSGSTNSALNFTNVQLQAAGNYSVIVTDEIGATPSRIVTLLVQIAPFIVQQPGPPYLKMLEGERLILHAVAGPIHPTLPLSIRWRRNGLFIPDQTNATLSILLTNLVPTNALSSSNGFTYVLSNPVPPPVISSNVTVIVQADRDGDGMGDAWEEAFGLDRNNPADALLDPDGDGLINLREFRAATDPTNSQSTLVMKLQLPPGGQPLITFNAISNKTYSVLWRERLDLGQWTTLTNLSWRRTNWQAAVSDPYPLGMSRVYELVTPMTGETMPPGPVLLTSPESVTVNDGQPAQLRAQAAGTGLIQYQWFFDDAELPGQISSILRFEPARTNHHGSYTVRISDDLGSLFTPPVQLTVLVPPVIQQQPFDTIVAVGGAAAFAVQATGVEPLHYQWVHDGHQIRGATGRVLILSNVQKDGAGVYAVLICHTPPTGRAYVWSNGAKLQVLP